MGRAVSNRRRGYRHNIEGREQQIRQLADAGLSERQIALALSVSKSTVHYWMTKQEKQVA
jgi:DNA-binding NarL/FixJ family response regulator